MVSKTAVKKSVVAAKAGTTTASRKATSSKAAPNPRVATRPQTPAKKPASKKKTPFRFYDNRQNYLSFINTTNEKYAIATRAGKEFQFLHPHAPALRMYDAGMGDATVLSDCMRALHQRFPTVPLVVVAKEISMEDVRIGLDKMVDRFCEHPATVLVLTNLNYADCRLMPANVASANAMNWQEIQLEGSSSYGYKEQLEALHLLRNDLGRVCSFGSVRVPELMRLERFSHVQHLVSTVEGRLRAGVTHLAALEACFPGGSITGAPKFRAMQLIDELEPVGRGPYTGALGYLGFNRQSRLSLIIRAAFCTPAATWYYAGAGIVADSDPAAESAETRAKARGFLDCLDNRGAEIQTLNRDDETGRGAKDAEKDAEKDAHVGVRERRVGTRG